MTPDGFGFSVVDIGKVHVVRLTGELDLTGAEGLAQRIVAVAGSTVVVDLAELAFVDAAGLRALVAARNQVETAGHSLVLTRPKPNVLRVLDISGLADWVSEWSPEWSEVDG